MKHHNPGFTVLCPVPPMSNSLGCHSGQQHSSLHRSLHSVFPRKRSCIFCNLTISTLSRHRMLRFLRKVSQANSLLKECLVIRFCSGFIHFFFSLVWNCFTCRTKFSFCTAFRTSFYLVFSMCRDGCLLYMKDLPQIDLRRRLAQQNVNYRLQITSKLVCDSSFLHAQRISRKRLMWREKNIKRIMRVPLALRCITFGA
jgi:hypothetical protein